MKDDIANQEATFKRCQIAMFTRLNGILTLTIDRPIRMPC